MKNQWNKDIRDQLKGFPKKAPEGLLDDIKSEMTRRSLSSSPIVDKSKRLLPVGGLQIVSVAAVLLILFCLGHLWKSTSTLPMMTEYMETPLRPILPIDTREENNFKELPITNISPNLISQTSKLASFPTNTSIEEEKGNVAAKQNENTENENREKKNEQPKNENTQETKKEYTPAFKEKKWTYRVSNHKKSSVSFGIYYSGIVTLNNLSFKDNYNIDLAPPAAAPPTNSPTDSNEIEGGENISTDTTSVVISRVARSTYDIHNFKGTASHYLPVKLGLSFRYNFSERWNLQSGLIYSYLASDLEEIKQEGTYDIKQKLHYLGIPLQVGYQTGKGKQFKSYITAGGQMEKLISGKATIRYSEKSQLLDTSTQNVSDKKLLFSALASIGIEYMLGNNFSLYAEPGIHYYFKNGNKLQTHYNEQPLNINLTIGFRFHWEK